MNWNIFAKNLTSILLAMMVSVGSSQTRSMETNDNKGVIWTKYLQFDVNSQGSTYPGFDNGNIYVLKYNQLMCIDEQSGQTKWSVKEDRAFDSHIDSFTADAMTYIVGDTIPIICLDGIKGYNKSTGKILWKLDCKPQSWISNSIGSKAIVIVDNKFEEINVEKGTVEKIFNKPNIKEQRALVYRTEDKAVITNKSNAIIIVDLISGNIIRNEKVNKEKLTIPIISENMVYYISPSEKNVSSITCYDLEKQSVKWSNPITSFSNIVIEGDRLFLGNCCFDKNNGNQLWINKKIEDKYFYRCVYKKQIMAFTEHGTYTAYDQSNGNIDNVDNRITQLEETREFDTKPVQHNNNIYLSSAVSPIWMMSDSVSTVKVSLNNNYSYVGNRRVWIDDPPLIKDGLMYVNPVSVIEPLGGRVGGFTLKEYYRCIYNNEVVELSMIPSGSKRKDIIENCIEVNKTVFVPLRKLTDIYGLKLTWSAKTKTATISKP